MKVVVKNAVPSEPPGKHKRPIIGRYEVDLEPSTTPTGIQGRSQHVTEHATCITL